MVNADKKNRSRNDQAQKDQGVEDGNDNAHLRIGHLQAVTECLSQKGGGARAEEDGGRRDLGIGHKKTVVLFSRHVESLMFEEKGDHPYVNQDVCARGVPDPCG